jgi:hypothetical protein
LSLSENYYGRQFIKLVRPAFKIPSRFQVSGRLLEAEYERVQSGIKKKISLADSLTCETVRTAHTAVFIAQVIGDAIHTVRSNKVHAVVTDNAANMKAA